MNDGHGNQACEGRWNWDSHAGRLAMSVPPGSPLRDLKGSWSQDGLASLIDGLSRQRLARSLDGGDISVNCALRLSDGRRVQLVGAFLSAGDAQGLILSDEETVDAAGAEQDPGPELDPVYQPIIALAPGHPIVGFEALARWRGEVTGRFDDDGLALNMLVKAADALAAWQASTGRADLFVHVNLTGRDLEEPGLPNLIATLIEGHGLAPGALKIELTEQAALRDVDAALNAAHRIKAAGAGLVLDDFGTGHSSFAWLADLPADGIKIDHALTCRSGEPRTRAILESVTQLGHRLGMRVTAEGVEIAREADALAQIGFDQVQGFAFGRPAGLARSSARLAASRSGAAG